MYNIDDDDTHITNGSQTKEIELIFDKSHDRRPPTQTDTHNTLEHLEKKTTDHDIYFFILKISPNSRVTLDPKNM